LEDAGCKAAAKPDRASGWKKMRLGVTKTDKSKLKKVQAFEFKEDFPYKPKEKVTIGGFVFECIEAKAEECPYVDPKDPDGGRDVWKATGESGEKKPFPEQKEVDAIPAEFVFENADKF